MNWPRRNWNTQTLAPTATSASWPFCTDAQTGAEQNILLLLEGAKGTRYASFREELYDTMRSAFSLFFHRYGAPDADAELIRILVEMRMKGTLELLKGEYSMEHVLRLTQQTGIYADGGFRSLIAFLQKNSKG